MRTKSHTDTLRALLQLQRDLALEVDLDRVLEKIARAACEILDADRATIYVIDESSRELWSRVLTGDRMREIRLPLDGRGLAAEVARSGQVISIADAYEDPRFNPEVDARSGYRTRTLLIVPIESREGKRIGVLQAVNKRDGDFDGEDAELGRALAASAGIALEHAQLHGELREERLRVARIGGEVRRRLARDLHDTVAQTLANSATGLEIAAQLIDSDRDAATRELAQQRERLLEAQGVLRDILFELRPVVLETGGLAEAVKALAQRLDGTTTKVEVGRLDAETRLRPEVEAGAFGILREAANNAVKHGAKRVVLEAFEEKGETVLRVQDDGAGFDVGAVLANYASRGSLGLLQIRESARTIGAQLVLDSSPGHGTRVVLRVPHEPPVIGEG